MAAPSSVSTIDRVAKMLGEDEDLLRDIALDMEPEDGVLTVWDIDEMSTVWGVFSRRSHHREDTEMMIGDDQVERLGRRGVGHGAFYPRTDTKKHPRVGVCVGSGWASIRGSAAPQAPPLLLPASYFIAEARSGRPIGTPPDCGIRRTLADKHFSDNDRTQMEKPRSRRSGLRARD